MKNTAINVKILLPLLCALIVAPGCAHQSTGGGQGSVSAYSLLPQQEAESQFVKDVGNLPIDQRQAYVQSHMDQVDQLKMDPDKTEMTQLLSLLPRSTP